MTNSLVSLSDELASTVDKAAQSVVAVHARRRIESSGVHWSPGIVVTACHTIRRDDGIRITTTTGATLNAELVGRDPGTDLAVLRVDGLEDPLVERSKLAQAVPGQIALAVGRSKDSPITAISLIESLSPASQTWRGGRLDRVIRLTLDLHPGAAGGMVVDAAGQFIGIATDALSRFSTFAIPPETISRVSENLLKHGRIPRGYLGAGLQPIALPEHLKTKLGLSSPTGLVAMSVDREAPAGRAGMSIGDVLVELNGQSVARPEKVQELLNSDSVGKKMPVKIVRGGEAITLEVTIGERPGR